MADSRSTAASKAADGGKGDDPKAVSQMTTAADRPDPEPGPTNVDPDATVPPVDEEVIVPTEEQRVSDKALLLAKHLEAYRDANGKETFEEALQVLENRTKAADERAGDPAAVVDQQTDQQVERSAAASARAGSTTRDSAPANRSSAPKSTTAK